MGPRELLSLVVMISLGAIPDEPARAQTYPSRPIQLIVPFSVGQVTDVLARAFGEGVGAELGQPVVVINREGAGGTLGFAAAVNAAPDGYTAVFAPQGALTIQPHVNPNLPYRVEAIAPICQVFESAFVVIAGPTSPIGDFNDLVTRARARPKSLSWGTLGIATIPTIQFMGLARKIGIDLLHVPYRTNGQMMQDVLAGRLDFAVPAIGSFGGANVRVLAALTGQARSPAYPDAPTVTELGYSVSMPGFTGLYAAKTVSAAVLERLEAVCSRVATAERFTSVARKLGSSPAFLPASTFAQRIAEDSREKATLVRQLGITDK